MTQRIGTCSKGDGGCDSRDVWIGETTSLCRRCEVDKDLWGHRGTGVAEESIPAKGHKASQDVTEG